MAHGRGGRRPQRAPDVAGGHPRPAGAARGARGGGVAELGADDPALRHAVRRVVGHRRPGRPRRRRCVGGRPGRRLRPRQPVARGGAGTADRALALPADQPPVRQPPLHQGRGRARGGLPVRGRAPAGGVARRRRQALPRPGPHRAGRRLDGQGGRPADDLPAASVAAAGAGLPRLRRARGAGSGRLRDLVRAVPGARHLVAQLARGAAGPPQRRGRGLPREARRRGGVPLLAAVDPRRPAGPGAARPGRHRDVDRADLRPGRGRAPGRGGRLGAGRRARPRRDRRGPGGPVQPARAGLEPAAVAARQARRARLRPLPRHGPGRAARQRRAAGGPCHRTVPSVVDPAGAQAVRGHLRALRPRGHHRHPPAGGPPGRRRRRRRGPGHRRAVGARLPA